jgi:hypothetical protein
MANVIPEHVYVGINDFAELEKADIKREHDLAAERRCKTYTLLYKCACFWTCPCIGFVILIVLLMNTPFITDFSFTCIKIERGESNYTFQLNTTYETSNITQSTQFVSFLSNNTLHSLTDDNYLILANYLNSYPNSSDRIWFTGSETRKRGKKTVYYLHINYNNSEFIRTLELNMYHVAPTNFTY